MTPPGAGTGTPIAGGTTRRPTVAAPRPLLRVGDVSSLVIGIVVGAGVFSIPSVVAANAGSATDVMLAWGAGGLLSLVGAMCYAELATSQPDAGGEYHFLRLAYGEKIAFLFAWARLTVIPTGSIALLAFIFGDYASQLWRIGGAYSASVHAALAICLLTLLNILGLRSGKGTQNLLTALQLAGVAAIILSGLLLAPAGGTLAVLSAAPGETQWGLVMIFVMLAYGGWNEAAYVSSEVQRPARNIPRGLLWSLGGITVLYLLMNWAYLRVLGLDRMGQSEAVAAEMMAALPWEYGAGLISAAVAIAAVTSANATILMASRTTYALGRDAPLFAMLGRWHPRLDAPVVALVVQATIALLLVLLGTLTREGFATMVEYTAPVFWLFFLLTGVSLFVLRHRMPGLARPFRVPLYPLTPLVFCATCAYLLYASLRHTGVGALVGLGVLATGVLVLLVGGSGVIPAQQPLRIDRSREGETR
ncbi:MAG: amino acid permease [Lysobacter spongiicola]|nr:amino acid permease [Lysobacter spongiicola]